MSFPLKPLSRDAVPAAMAKAERYRLLNQPMQAASICEDVLLAEPGHHDALVTLLLSLTELFSEIDSSQALGRAEGLVARLPTEYERAYYSGIISERRAWSILVRSAPGGGFLAFEWLRDAMRSFEQAEQLRSAGNDDAILRWNACARMLMEDSRLQAPADDRDMPLTLE